MNFSESTEGTSGSDSGQLSESLCASTSVPFSPPHGFQCQLPFLQKSVSASRRGESRAHPDLLPICSTHPSSLPRCKGRSALVQVCSKPFLPGELMLSRHAPPAACPRAVCVCVFLLSVSVLQNLIFPSRASSPHKAESVLPRVPSCSQSVWDRARHRAEIWSCKSATSSHLWP